MNRGGRTGHGPTAVAAAVVAVLVVGACLVAYTHPAGAAAAHHAQWVRADAGDPVDAAPALALAGPPPAALAAPVAPGRRGRPRPAVRREHRLLRSPAPARAPPAPSLRPA